MSEDEIDQPQIIQKLPLLEAAGQFVRYSYYFDREDSAQLMQLSDTQCEAFRGVGYAEARNVDFLNNLEAIGLHPLTILEDHERQIAEFGQGQNATEIEFRAFVAGIRSKYDQQEYEKGWDTAYTIPPIETRNKDIHVVRAMFEDLLSSDIVTEYLLDRIDRAIRNNTERFLQEIEEARRAGTLKHIPYLTVGGGLSASNWLSMTTPLTGTPNNYVVVREGELGGSGGSVGGMQGFINSDAQTTDPRDTQLPFSDATTTPFATYSYPFLDPYKIAQGRTLSALCDEESGLNRNYVPGRAIRMSTAFAVLMSAGPHVIYGDVNLGKLGPSAGKPNHVEMIIKGRNVEVDAGDLTIAVGIGSEKTAITGDAESDRLLRSKIAETENYIDTIEAYVREAELEVGQLLNIRLDIQARVNALPIEWTQENDDLLNRNIDEIQKRVTEAIRELEQPNVLTTSQLNRLVTIWQNALDSLPELWPLTEFFNPNSRVAIAGAGNSGLVAAELLTRTGPGSIYPEGRATTSNEVILIGNDKPSDRPRYREGLKKRPVKVVQGRVGKVRKSKGRNSKGEFIDVFDAYSREGKLLARGASHLIIASGYTNPIKQEEFRNRLELRTAYAAPVNGRGNDLVPTSLENEAGNIRIIGVACGFERKAYPTFIRELLGIIDADNTVARWVYAYLEQYAAIRFGQKLRPSDFARNFPGTPDIVSRGVLDDFYDGARARFTNELDRKRFLSRYVSIFRRQETPEAYFPRAVLYRLAGDFARNAIRESASIDDILLVADALRYTNSELFLVEVTSAFEKIQQEVRHIDSLLSTSAGTIQGRSRLLAQIRKWNRDPLVLLEGAEKGENRLVIREYVYILGQMLTKIEQLYN